MADNSLRTPGTGETIATKDVGGTKSQRVQLQVGGPGVVADVQPPDADALASSRTLPAAGLVWNGTTWDRVAEVSANAVGPTGIPMVAQMLYNGVNYDRSQGNKEGTLLASAARTAQTSSANQTNFNFRGAILYLNATVVGTGTVTLIVEGIDPVTANNFTLCAGVAVSASTTLHVYPGVLDAEISADARSAALPRTWRATVNKSDASSWTYSLGYALIL